MKYLDAIEARAKAATPGPWAWRSNQPTYGNILWSIPEDVAVLAQGLGLLWTRDNDFIAHARTDIEALLQLLRVFEKARYTLNALKGWFPAWAREHDAVLCDPWNNDRQHGSLPWQWVRTLDELVDALAVLDAEVQP